MDPAQLAISAALNGEWNKAIEINLKILKQTPQDVDSLNRLARAYAELGNLTTARKYVKRVLIIDPFNSIAKRSAEKWKELKKGDSISMAPSKAESFIEEPGKTKIIPLINLGGAKILAKLDAGDEVKLNPYGHRVSILTLDGKYIGRLPDDLGCKIKKLVNSGNIYKVIIKCCEPKNIKVFIKEIASAKKEPTFTSERIDYVAFTPPELVHKKDDILHTEDEES
jgi:tetratricopeptide (TPR) repeat protein